MARKNNSRKLNLENLEARDLKAGNITLTVVNEELRVTGDDNANQLEIHQSVGNIYRVTGLNGTKINGKEDKLISFKGGIRVDLRGGDDQILMGGSTFVDDVHGNLTILTGQGKDKVTLGKVDVQGSTNINTDTEADIVNLTNGNYNDLSVNTGAGDDHLNLSSVNARKLTAVLGSGADAMFAKSISAEVSADIQAGSEADLVTLDSVGTLELSVDTAAGDDVVTMRKTFFTNDIGIDTGADNDTVKFENAVIFGELVVDTDEGDDNVVAEGMETNNDVTIRTGIGNDSVLLTDVGVPGGGFGSPLNMLIETSDGDDLVDLTRVNLFEDLRINTGSQQDLVRLAEVEADRLFANLGTNQDEFRIRDSDFSVAVIDGGDNFDKFFDLLGNDIDALTLNNFESIQ